MSTLHAEMRILVARMSTIRSILPHLALLVVFGITVPRMKGLDFLDSPVLAAYACLGIIFAAPATAQSFPDGLATSFKQAKARILMGVLYGETVALTVLALGICTVYVSNRGGYVPTPDWIILAKSAIFGLCAAALLASVAAWITLRFSRRIAIICLRVAFFGLLILFYYRGQQLPDVGLTGATGSLLMTLLFIKLLRRTCELS